MEKCRQKALHDGVLLDNNQPYVKAKLVTNSNSYRVKKLKELLWDIGFLDGLKELLFKIVFVRKTG